MNTDWNLFWAAMAGITAFAMACFLLGFKAALTAERRAHRATIGALQRIDLRERRLARWVREHWPTEYAAYLRGHREGYQQGVEQSAELDERAGAT